MSVVNAARLRLEIARRGWNAVILAHDARLSPVSVQKRSAVCIGGHVAAMHRGRSGGPTSDGVGRAYPVNRGVTTIGTIATGTTTSTAPMSQPGPWGRVTPR
jgi:hypothetical protein